MNPITSYTEQDVLCGRGGGTLRHSGNKKYRSLIKSSKPVYLISSKNEKTAISRSIVAAIRKTGGHFLERSKNLESWYDIGDAKATEKTSQALREGQPKLRKTMIDRGIITDDNFHNSISTTENMISLLPTGGSASQSQIVPNPVFGDDSYTSVDKNDTRTKNQERSTFERSLSVMLTDMESMMDNPQRPHVIGDSRFQPLDHPIETSQFRIVTPPSTPPISQQHPIDFSQNSNNMIQCPFSIMNQQAMTVSNNIDDRDFDDSSSIMTFEMYDEEIIDDDDDEMDDDDCLASSLHSNHPIYPVKIPPPSLTNHFRALTELKDNVPIYDFGDDDESMFQHTSSMHSSPITKHLLNLAELKHQVPIYPSSSYQCDNRFNSQFNGNVSRSDIGFAPSMGFPSQMKF